MNQRTPFRVGPIVAVSIFGGLAAALFLVLVPFGGAQEHVVMGVALLGWALGWGLLAFLTTRFTDQPQRWAAVPAVAMAVAGAGLLAFRPDANGMDLLAWFWPPALVALAVWMLFQSRRNLRSRARVLILYPLLAGIALAGVAGSYETVQERIDRSSAAMPGHLVDVGGRRLYIHCTGAGAPTVVLISGLAEPATYWDGWVAPAVAKDTTVCDYDRAGQGWSDPPAAPQDGAAVAADLHNLLARAGVAGPYVLAAHSTGGVYARIYASRYPDQVAGMVFVDSQPNEALTELPTFPGFYSAVRPASALFPSLSRLGLFRLIGALGSDPLPATERREEVAITSTADLNRIQRDEFANLPETLTEAGALTSLGDRPLVVLTAEKDAMTGWMPLQDRMVRLSTNSVHRYLKGVDHPGTIHDPAGAAATSRAILDVVSFLRSGTPLPAS